MKVGIAEKKYSKSVIARISGNLNRISMITEWSPHHHAFDETLSGSGEF